MEKVIWIIAITFATNFDTYAQQVPDLDFKPKVAPAAYAKEEGPIILIDAGHKNFHKADGRFGSFARLLEEDGYKVTSAETTFTKSILEGVSVLVIANALSKQNERYWALPVYPAFTQSEIEVVRQWVEEGGALLLIADHMPFGGAAANLARPFGAEFENAYTFAPDHKTREPDLFTTDEATLKVHPITRGRSEEERVTVVGTFGGHAFKTSKDLVPLLVFKEGAVSRYPEVAGEINSSTPRKDVGGWAHAATGKYEKGRVALFGEAAMFSAQRAGPNKMPAGMNHEDAAQNGQFVLNVLHWLTGLLDEPENRSSKN